MSLTRMLRKLLTRSGSRGVSRMTVGLLSVGPPPELMKVQLLASAPLDGAPGRDTRAAVRDDKVGQPHSLWGRWEFGHLEPPLVGSGLTIAPEAAGGNEQGA